MIPKKRNRRSAVIVAFTAVSLILLLGFAGLAIDLGHGYAIKAKMQNTSDAAALAGVAALFSDDSVLKAYDPTPDILSDVAEFAAQNADANSLGNKDTGAALKVCSSDIVIGHITDPTDFDEAIDTSNPEINAVEVTMRRDKNCNGPIGTFLAGTLGINEMHISATATAFYDDRFAGFFPPPVMPGPLLPFAVSRAYYEKQLQEAKDNLSWNSTTSSVDTVPDGILEIWIFPEGHASGPPTDDALPDDGAGNYGTLNIGINNVGASFLGDQIADGITQQQMIDTIGQVDMRFIDESGDALSHTIEGNPGFSAGISVEVEKRIGDIVGFFLHDGVTNNGSSSEFEITGIVFGRLLEVVMKGDPSLKRVVVQPAVYGGPGVITDPSAPSSGGLVATIRLIR